MTDDRIGEAAGLIWEYLSSRGDATATLGSLKKIPGVRADMAMAAVGWLAREGKLRFDDSKRHCTISLFEEQHCMN